MSTATASSKIPELRRSVRQAHAAAFLVEPRVVRRIIRELHGFARLSTRIPHTEVLVVAAQDVTALAHPDELGLQNFDDLPSYSILVAQPEEHEMEAKGLQDLMRMVWARLFHGVIDLSLQSEFRAGDLTRAKVQACIDELGQVEFDEAHSVLRSEHRLISPESHIEAYCEFAALYSQLARFNPDLVPLWFPSLAETSRVTSILAKHFDSETLCRSTRLYGATEPDLVPASVHDEALVASERLSWGEGLAVKPSLRRYARLMKKRERWNERGNTVAAGVAAMRAAENAVADEERSAALEQAKNDANNLADRLQSALQFADSELGSWRTSLWELLKNSTHGFWNAEKKLLYDLQKVCLDNERTIYHVDLLKWVFSRGRRPLRRPLLNIREVMMAKHLASSAARLVYVRLSGEERDRLSGLLHSAADLAENQMRGRMRSALHQTILDVGLIPGSIPERVAFDKMVEESLDCITERGYLTMGYLRDAISRNDLKLPDLTDPVELIRGDHLLRANDRLDLSLDGVYRRGEFYLRWLQVISSIAFGTRTGRFLTQFLVIPFGGAVVIVEGVQHLIKVLAGPRPGLESVANSEDPAANSDPLGSTGGDAISGVAPPPTDLEPTQEDGVAPELNQSETAGSESPVVGLPEVGDNGLPVDPTDDSQSLQVEYELPIDGVLAELEIPSIAIVGFLLMAVIHIDSVRTLFFTSLRYLWKLVRTVIYDIPAAVIRMPAIQRIWRARFFVKLRRYLINPFLVAWLGCRILPWLFYLQPRDWWLVGTIGVLLSLAVNSRLGRDAEELTAEWLANAWYDLRTRFVMALLDWVIDFFKWMLNLLERFIYAVDEWLRFHSGETWATVVVKAILGVVWSCVSFVLRIYVNLLIEPTLHPVKHFPVVTVAHKVFLPVIIIIERNMRNTLTPYLGVALAGPITWFNIVFLPGIFGFLVWELKENWRLYASNRVQTLHPVVIGSHGETGGRLLKPGFHSGTLPKLFGKMRRLERKDSSFQRFSQRRALHERLAHSECDIRRFVDRDLIRLLNYCPVWQNVEIECRQIKAASNSFLVELHSSLGREPVHLLFQEQSRWLVASVARPGWLKSISPERQHSFETALRGFYAKAGVDLVREQIERNLTGAHPYDVCGLGLAIWPDGLFDRQINVDLNRRHQIRPTPPSMAASYGIQPVSREAAVFSESKFRWADWQRVWATPEHSESSNPLPLACMQSARTSLLSLGRNRA